MEIAEKNKGEGNGNPPQHSCLENPMERWAWQAAVHGVTRVGHNLATKPPEKISKHKAEKQRRERDGI